ncbi:unnamed protein product [Rotaria socialis]|uniref:Uncharacterized protein n=2 Tax=Rotaria socialis TaxID=392032 RepID=A0A819TVJ1_9BILA|nr:unnamed protein product [Rotaria socialis]CAF4087317.1 unnamed protein product [Rotaria socialis]CAF4508947.1 unnamed protein product [Rotaria socialis]
MSADGASSLLIPSSSKTPSSMKASGNAQLSSTETISEVPSTGTVLSKVVSRDSFNATQKYKFYFDDSSSEEDEELLKSTKLLKIDESSKALTKINITYKLSFIAHEVAEHVWRSKEVNDIYYKEKRTQLPQNKNKIINDDRFRTWIDDCAKESYLEWTGADCIDENVFTKTTTKNQLEQIKKHVLENKRKFIEYFYHGLAPTVNAFVESMRTFVESFYQSAQCIHSLKIIDEDGIRKFLINELQHLDCYKKKHKIGDTVEMNSKSRLLHSQAAKREYNNIEKKSPSGLKKTLFDLLLNNTKNISIETFIAQHRETLQASYVTQEYADIFMINFSQKVKNELMKKSNSLSRALLSDQFLLVPNTKDYTAINFIARLRLINRSAIRRLKNDASVLQQITGYDKYSIIHIYVFPCVETQFIEHQQFIIKSKTRVDKILALGSYNDIFTSIGRLEEHLKVNDAEIATWVWNTFKGDHFNLTTNTEANLTSDENFDIKVFIGSLAALLFGTEVSRNIVCIIIHPMMLELIMKEELTWEELLIDDTLMPMASDGATAASRSLRVTYKHYLSLSYRSYSYDYAKKQILSSDDASVVGFVKKEHYIIDMWIRMKSTKKYPENIPTEDVISMICQAVKGWYGIDIVNDFS